MRTQARATSENDAILSKKQQEWARRMEKISDEQSTDASTPWYIMAWSTCIGMATGIQDAFQSTPFIKLFYPDNPGTREILHNVGFSILPNIVKYASPIAIVMLWINAGLAIRRFTKAENKNIWEYGNLFFSCAAPIIFTSLLIAGITISVTFLAPILPWVFVGIFGVFACKGLFDCVTNCYRAWCANKEGDKEARNEYLKCAAKNVIGIVFNVLALTTSFILGVKMSEAGDKLNDAFEYFKKTLKVDKLNEAKELASNLFTQGSKLLGALTGVAVVGVLADHSKFITDMNKETASALRHPGVALTTGWNRFTSRPLVTLLNMLIGLIKLPLRVTLFVALGPIQALSEWIKKPSTPIDETAQRKTVRKEILNFNNKVQTKLANYNTLIKEKYNNELSQVPDKIKAKRMLLKQIQENKHESVDTIIAKVKKNVRTGKGGEFDFNGSVVFDSMFKRKGEVQRLSETACALEKIRHKTI